MSAVLWSWVPSALSWPNSASHRPARPTSSVEPIKEKKTWCFLLWSSVGHRHTQSVRAGAFPAPIQSS